MIANKLLQRQRAEVENEREGFNDIGCDEIILKTVLLTEVPNVANPMAHVLESLTNKLDAAGEVFDVHNKSRHMDSLKNVSDKPDSVKVKRSHKVLVEDKLLNEYEEDDREGCNGELPATDG